MKVKIIGLFIILSLVILPYQVGAQTNDNSNINANTNEEVEVDFNDGDEVTSNSNTNSSSGSDRLAEAEDIVNDPGLLPDSPFYTLKSWWEEVQFFFTFNNEKKAELQQRFALRKIAEANKMIEKGKTELAAKHLQRAQKNLEKFQENANKIKDVSEDKKDDLVSKFESIQKKQQDVLTKVYSQVPEQAQETILKAIETSAQGLINAIERVNQSGGVDADELKANIKNRLENSRESMKDEIMEKLDARGVFNHKDGANGEESEDDVSDDTNSNSNTNTEVDEDDDDTNLNSNTNTEVEEEDEEENQGEDDSSTNSNTSTDDEDGDDGR